MRKFNLYLLFLLFHISAFAEVKEQYFEQALQEISNMLNDKTPISFKRAVFVTENAWNNGQLDYNQFCQQIDETKSAIQHMIVAKGLQGYKTAGNWAIFSYMTENLPENGNCKMTYDIESLFEYNTMGGYFVSSLLNTKKGNCHSMPYFYKIMADEVGVEAFIATAPLHLYVKHKDETGKWWNLELTTGTFARTSFIIDAFGVTDAGMASGLYMKPLDGKELLTLCLCDLISYYQKKTGKYYGDFVHQACDVGLKYNKASELQLWKADAMKYDLTEKMNQKRLSNYNQLNPYPKLLALYNKVEQKKAYIHEIGYYKMLPQEYRKKIEEVQSGKYSKYQK